MIRKTGRILTGIGLPFWVIWFIWGCANPVTPQGGPKDEQGPYVIEEKVEPQPGTLNFTGKEVVLKFNEYVRQPNYGQEIFISPLLKEQPKISLNGKKLKVRFREYLRPSTTYVLSFTDVKDYNASNPMPEAYTLAFSTGSVIDSMEINGVVEGKQLGKGQKDITLLLFDADSIEDNDFMNKQPAYVTKTNESGRFRLPFLRNTRFRIYGVEDIDKSNTFSLATEKVALADSALVIFSDSSRFVSVNLLAFAPDQRPPGLRSYEWLSDSVLRCEFSEGLNTDSLRLSISDTLGENEVRLNQYTYLEGSLYILSPRKQAVESWLRLEHVSDSLGNYMDSLLVVLPKKIRKPKDRIPKAPELNPDSQHYTWYMYHYLSASEQSLISLVDTSGKALPVMLKQNAFKYHLKPDTLLRPEDQYFIEMAGSLFGDEDTSYRYPVVVLNPENFGTFQGKVQVVGYYGPVVITFSGKGKEYVLYDTLFNYRYMEPGTYTARALLDRDGNGVWTPGSIDPYRMPERIARGSGTFSIRANWDFEDQTVVIDPFKKPEPLPEGGPNPDGLRPEDLPPELRIDNRN